MQQVKAMNSSSIAQLLQNWQRLSALSMVFFVGKTVSRFIKDALPGMAPLIIILFNSDNKTWIIGGILIALLVVISVGSFLQFWYFKYQLEDHKMLINDGVFKKNHRVIQFDRIQNINILQPLYFKPFGLVTLQIETAGAKGNEADLAGISRKTAEFLRNRVLQFQAEHGAALSGSNVSQTAHQQSAVIAKASIQDLVKYGVSSNGIFWFFVFLAPVFGLADEFLEKIVTKEDFANLAEWLGGGITGNILIVVGTIFLTLVLMFSFSILGAILRYYGYQLTTDKAASNVETVSNSRSLKRSSGLLTQYEESLKLQKIQTLITQSNFLGRWLKVENLTLGQVSTSQNQAKNKKSLFVIPARSYEQSIKLQSIVFDNRPESIETCGIDRRYVYKTILFKVFLPILLVTAILFFNRAPALVLTLPFIVSLLLLPLVLRRWRGYRYGMKEGYGEFQRGLFGYRHILFPLFKVQRAEIKQTPFQRRRGLATLKIYLASNRIQMQYIPMKQANLWLKVITQQIQQSNKAWY